jgi:DNA-directed RNA polymerase specialized sigma24 family protein
MDERERKRGWSLTKPAFDKLMARLGSAEEPAGERYLRARRNLVRYFEGRRSRLAEEQADETINRVARRLDEGAEIQNIDAYLYGVARLVMLEAIDERDRERKALGEVSLRLVPPSAAEGDETGPGLDCLGRCLDRLPADARTLIVQYYQGERRSKIENRQRLADALGIPLQALRARVLRLREKLEACVSACLGRRAPAV